MFKKLNRKGNARTRDDQDQEDETKVVKKQKATPQTASSTSTKGHSFTAARAYTTSGTKESLESNTATRSLDIDGHSSKPPTETKTGDDETYSGINGYTKYINKPNNTSKSLVAGPLKAPTNIKTVTRFDFAMGICKDYKETGHCGFGDSCVFMHDRGDYKASWQLEKEWEEEQLKKKNKEPQDEPVEEAEESFDCQVCGNEYKDPVITKCGHVMCEKDALKNSKKCPVCKTVTAGAFVVAKDVKARLKAKKDEIARMEAEIRQRIGNPLEEEED